MSITQSAQITHAALLGRLLQHHRERCGLSQAQAGAALGMMQPSYSRIEKGNTAITVVQLQMLATAFGLRASYILAEAEAWADTLAAQGVTIAASKEVPQAALLIGLALLAAGLLMAPVAAKR